MPAPDYATCYKVRSSIQQGIVTVLDNALTETVITSFENVSKSTPRVEVTFQLNNPTGHYGQDQAGNWIKDAWEATLTCEAITNRDDTAQDSEGMIAGIREALQNYQDAFGEDVLPYHFIVDLIEQSSTPSEQAEEDQDIADIVYTVKCGIRSTAWPDV